MLLAGPDAEALAQTLAAFGMRLSVAGAEVGAAAAIKMVRGVIIKGIEALTLECFLAAARAGVVDEVAASIKNNYPGIDWAKMVPYNLERMASHGERRAAEMEAGRRNAAGTRRRTADDIGDCPAAARNGPDRRAAFGAQGAGRRPRGDAQRDQRRRPRPPLTATRHRQQRAE